jgi:two-component system, NtrC family, sensor kinase
MDGPGRELQSLADALAENAQLRGDLEIRNAELAEALERQVATAEVLRIIAQSPAELQPVLDAIAESASHLLPGADVVIRQREGELLRAVAHAGHMPFTPGNSVGLDLRAPASLTGRAVAERRTVQLADVE